MKNLVTILAIILLASCKKEKGVEGVTAPEPVKTFSHECFEGRWAMFGNSAQFEIAYDDSTFYYRGIYNDQAVEAGQLEGTIENDTMFFETRKIYATMSDCENLTLHLTDSDVAAPCTRVPQ